MIIQALIQYYDILAQEKQPRIPLLGYSTAKVSFVLEISKDGDLAHIIDIRTKDKKPRPREMTVPKQGARANKITPYFLCDNAKYVFGVENIPIKEREKIRSDPSKIIAVLEDTETDLIIVSERSQKCFESFKALHHSVLDPINNDEANTLLKYLDSWEPIHFLLHPKITEYKDDLLSGVNFIFEVSKSCLHKNSTLRTTWENYCSQDLGDNQVCAQCLVSGEISPIPKTHQKIKGVVGAQSAGASLISFNDPAFCSYGKEQNYNAPIGGVAEFKYTTVLNHLLADQKSRIRIADSTVVFWAETTEQICEDLAQSLFNPPYEAPDATDQKGSEETHIRDAKTIQLISDILTKVRNAQPLNQQVIGVDPDTRFFILGLSPNNARLSVRFWYQDTFGNFVGRIARHHLDLEIYHGDFGPSYISIYRLLMETVPKSADNAKPSPILGGLILNAILNNTVYPIQMFNAILNRVKVERSINHVRAGFIKAYLLRMCRSGTTKLQEEMITVSLNEESMNVPYRLGRLFAVLEKVQGETNKDIGSTITNKFFSSASTTPATVFPVLIKLAQHHISKSDWGFKTNQAIEEILSEVDAFPAYLTLEDQGLFMLGYYHQKQAFYRKKQTTQEE